MTAETTAEPARPEDAVAKHTTISVSRGLAAWLAARNCSLAFTSHQSGQLLLVGRGAEGVVSLHQQDFPRAMGLYATPQRLHLAALHQIWRLENVLEAGQVANERFDRLYIPRNAQTVGDIDVHELAVDRSGRVVFINTKFSCLATTSETHSFTPLWKPPFISRLAAEDRCHLNGLAMEDGSPRYVTAVSRSDVASGWRDRREDGGIVIDLADDSVLTERLSMPHSPRVHAGALWALDSGRGHLVRIDRRAGTCEAVAFCPGFLRGLAFLDHFALVTASLPRGESGFASLEIAATLARKQAEPWCGVFVIDTRTGDAIEWVRLEGRIAELFDVAVLAGVVRPMSIGANAPELQTILTFDEAPLAI